MTVQEYIQTKLQELKQPVGLEVPKNSDELVDVITRTLLSKKFRKYSANDDLIRHIKNAIRINIENNDPINITFLHGAYKLWRLQEAPEVDWAELFSLVYYSNWVKPVCEIYQPGVWFDFFVDDYIVNRLNNIAMADIRAYIDSYQSLIDFLAMYQPQNLRMTITKVGNQFESESSFNESLRRNLEIQESKSPIATMVLDGDQTAMVELNAKPTDEQLQDPKWREKIYQLHNAYMATKAEPGYHKNRPEKILAFTQPLPSGTTISVGTTKSSVMKFWIGVGVLQTKDGGYTQRILSPNQLQAINYVWQNIDMGIPGKNFDRIRIIDAADK